MTCCICLDKKCDIITNCNHSFCKKCIQKLISDSHNIQYCPLCKKVLYYTQTNNMITRLQARLVTDQNQQNFNNKIRHFYTQINNIHNKQERINMIISMFDYIQDNLWIKEHYEYNRFIKQVRCKLDHYINVDKVDIFRKYNI